MSDPTGRPVRPRARRPAEPGLPPEPPTAGRPSPQADQEALRRNAQNEASVGRQAQFEAQLQRAVLRLGELLDHEDPRVVLAAAHELLQLDRPRASERDRITADDVEHDWERQRLRPRIWKGGEEALLGSSGA